LSGQRIITLPILLEMQIGQLGMQTADVWKLLDALDQATTCDAVGQDVVGAPVVKARDYAAIGIILAQTGSQPVADMRVDDAVGLGNGG
jgi:hypothetical protein